jgi:competence ComEA-like helix-hairpin-helix protein
MPATDTPDKHADKPMPAARLSPSEQAAREPWGWTRRQRVGLGILLSVLLAALAVQFVRRPSLINDTQVIINGKPVTLPQRIDPNAASLEDLARIPHVGESMAGKIVQWREARRASAVEGIVFHRAEDLDGVPGIGKKLVEQLRPFLTFPDDGVPDTAP